jgi:hypothetical protein
MVSHTKVQLLVGQSLVNETLARASSGLVANLGRENATNNKVFFSPLF